MPILTNPTVQQFLAQHGPMANSALRSSGLVAPFEAPDVVRMPGTLEANPTYRLGEAAGGLLEDKKLLEPLGQYAQALGSQQGHGRAMLLSALLGAAGGAGFGMTTRRDPWMWGLIGAGAGGLGGLGINQLMRYREAKRRTAVDQWLRKVSFYVSNEQNPMQYIQERLLADGSVGPAEKGQMVAALRAVPQSALFSLADMLRTAAGMAAGYIIGKFLMQFGGMGSAVMTGLGGLFGASLGGGRSSTNTLGLDANPSQDFFGRPRFVM